MHTKPILKHVEKLQRDIHVYMTVLRRSLTFSLNVSKFDVENASGLTSEN